MSSSICCFMAKFKEIKELWNASRNCDCITEISVLQNINKQQMHWKLKILNKNSIQMLKKLEVDTE